MIKWKGYSEAKGEDIEFCCQAMEHCYKEQHISYDVTVGKYCLRLPRRTKREVIRMEEGIVPGIEDNFVIDYCMFCGKNIYKDDLRFDTRGPGWGHINTGENSSTVWAHTYVCGRADTRGPGWCTDDTCGAVVWTHTYVCGRAANMNL